MPDEESQHGGDGQHVLVTGASGLIGAAISRRLVAEGNRLTLAGRNGEMLGSLADDLGRWRAGKVGSDVAEGPADIAGTHAGSVDETWLDAGRVVTKVVVEIDPALDNGEAIIADAEHASGPVDALVNCAGTATNGDPIDIGTAAYMASMTTKFGTYVSTSLAAARRFRERRRGSIINVVGVGGTHPFPSFLAGGAANAALLLFTEGLGRHLGPFGARAISVSPSMTFPPESAVSDDLRDVTPFGRFLNADDVAATVAFLLRAESQYINGSNIIIDGAKEHSA